MKREELLESLYSKLSAIVEEMKPGSRLECQKIIDTLMQIITYFEKANDDSDDLGPVLGTMMNLREKLKEMQSSKEKSEDGN